MTEGILKTGILAKDTYNGVGQTNLVSEIAEAIEKYNLDILFGPEWLFLPKEKLYSKEEKNDLIARLTEATKDKDSLIIPGSIMWFYEHYLYNTMPVISKSVLLGEYYKHVDGGSTVNAHIRNHKELEYYRGHGFGLYSWKGYKIGVEICADRGELERFLETRPHESLLDLYFLASCGTNLSKTSHLPIKNLGYGLCSNGDIASTPTQVLQKKDPYLETCSAKEYMPDIHLYELIMKKEI